MKYVNKELAILLICGIALVAGFWIWNHSKIPTTPIQIIPTVQPKTTTQIKSEFTLETGEEAKIVYEFPTAGTPEELEYTVSLIGIDTPSQTANFKSCRTLKYDYTPHLRVGDRFTCFYGEGDGVRFKLIKLENTIATLETWFIIGDTQVILEPSRPPLAPKRITITKKQP